MTEPPYDRAEPLGRFLPEDAAGCPSYRLILCHQPDRPQSEGAVSIGVVDAGGDLLEGECAYFGINVSAIRPLSRNDSYPGIA